MKYVVFARHGECENKSPYGLNEQGKTQIRNLGEALLSLAPGTVWSLVSSPLQRARESSDLLASIVATTGVLSIEKCLEDGFEIAKRDDDVKIRYVKDVTREYRVSQENQNGLFLVTYKPTFSYRQTFENVHTCLGQELYLGIPDHGQAYFYDLEAKTGQIIPQQVKK